MEEALRLDAKLVPALTLKAKLAMAAQRHDLARQSLERALAVDPQASYAQFLYGLQAYLHNEMKEALPRFQRARELAPRDPRAALYLGLATEAVGTPSDAMVLYEEAVRLERAAGAEQAETLLPGARLLLLLGRAEECGQWLRKAVKLAPRSRDVRFELARLLLKNGDAARATAEGELALSLSDGVTTDLAIRYVLVRAWKLTGNHDKAAVHASVIRAQESAAAAQTQR